MTSHYQDMVDKLALRGSTGHVPPTAKLNLKKARKIRKLYSTGWTQNQLADKYDVSKGTIRQIVTGRSWKE